MKSLVIWFLSLFINKDKVEVKKTIKHDSIVGVVKVTKKEFKENEIVMGKYVNCVISVSTNLNESVSFVYHIDKKLLILKLKGQTFDYLKIEYIKNKE